MRLALLLVLAVGCTDGLRCPSHSRPECELLTGGGVYCGCECEDACWCQVECEPALAHPETNWGEGCPEGDVHVFNWSVGACGEQAVPICPAATSALK